VWPYLVVLLSPSLDEGDGLESRPKPFGVEALQCPRCQGRMRLLALLTADREVRRYLRAIGEPTELPIQESARPPPYWKSRVLRRQELGDEAA
jgi:hypothetical protein